MPPQPSYCRHLGMRLAPAPTPVPPRFARGWERGPSRVQAVQPRPRWDGRSPGGSGSHQQGGLGAAGYTQQRARGGRQHHSSLQAPALTWRDTRQSPALSPELPPPHLHIYTGVPGGPQQGWGGTEKGAGQPSPVHRGYPWKQAKGVLFKLPCAWHTACSQPGAGRERAISISEWGEMSPVGPPRAKALPVQPQAAPNPSSRCVAGQGVKLGCREQRALGQAGQHPDTAGQWDVGLWGHTPGQDSRAACLLLQGQPLWAAPGTQLHFPAPGSHLLCCSREGQARLPHSLLLQHH